MANGFTNNDFNVEQAITANSFDGAYSIAVPGGWVSNLGLSYAGSVLGVRGATTTISATNQAYVIMQSKTTPGRLKKYTITAEQSFIDDTGVSMIIGNTFGWTTGVAITDDVPFYIYAVTNDAEDDIAFMISRIPGLSLSPIAAYIAAPDDAVAANQRCFFSFKNIDETLYDENPCLMIGSFKMQMSAADDWTVTALTGIDGIGCFQAMKTFSMPQGQKGAAAGGFISDNGGTAPTWTNQWYYYMIEPFSGKIHIQVNLNGDGGADGAGAVTSKLSLPFRPWVYGAGNAYYFGSGIISYAGGANSVFNFSASDNIDYSALVTLSLGASVQNGDFTNGNRIIVGSMDYFPDPVS